MGSCKNKNNIFQLLRTSKIVCILLSILVLFLFVCPADASLLDDKIKELQELSRQSQEYENKVEEKKGEINTLSAQIEAMDNQLDQTRAEIEKTKLQIEQNELEIENVSNQITEKEKEIEIQKELLLECVLIMYDQDQTSTLEIIASSDSFSSFLAKMEYMESIEKQTQNTLDEIEKLKQELEAQKTQLEDKKRELTLLKEELELNEKKLADQMFAKQQMLDFTKIEQVDLEKRAEESYAQAKQAQAEIAAMIGNNREGTGRWRGGGTGGYPWDGQQGVDPWGYYICQCTSYVAWRKAISGHPVGPPPWGNAKDWPASARIRGYKVDTIPEVGSIICWTGGTYGHVAYVESVNGDWVTFSDYNGWGGSLSYGMGTIKASAYGVQFIH